MAWNLLKTRLNTLPHVLAGPVLRQVTRDSVSVWFALRTAGKVKVVVYDGDTQLASAERDGAPVGVNLFFCVVTVPLASPLVENKIYFYDAFFDWGALSQNLSTAAGTTAGQFCYSPYAKPSFCLPPADLNKVRIFHGSCRKPHGEGPDALSLLDDILRDSCTAPYQRPQQLLLTGDQIYADDVADVLLLMVNDAGETLLGWQEKLPFDKSVGGPYASVDLPSYVRSNGLTWAQFTSDDLKSHLMSLSEYLAMYLFAWSDALWPAAPDTIPDYNDVRDWMIRAVPVDMVSEVKEGLEGQRKTIEQERSFIVTYRSTLFQVRRILANIPAYMICDDHEVTDDWNMTRRFCDLIYGTAAGVRIVQNGLTAFALCQAWGNRPDRFAASPATPGSALLGHFADVCASGAPSAMSAAYDQHSPAIQVLVGVHDNKAVLAADRVFHDGTNTLVNDSYTNPTSLRYEFAVEGAAHLILVTDTRTWRAYPGKSSDTHANFLGSYLADPELLHQIHLPGKLGDRLLLVVLTTNAPPIRSFRFAANHPTLIDVGKHHPGFWDFVDGIGGVMKPPPRWAGSTRAIYECDLFDSWEFPSDQVDRLIVQIDNLLKAEGHTQQVVLLSGDVHSSFASRLTYWVEHQRLGDPLTSDTHSQMVIAQLVGSALKNEKDDTRGQQKDGYEYAPSWLARRLVPNFRPEGYAGWNIPNVRNDDELTPLVRIAKPHYRYRLDYLVTAETGQNAPPPPVLIGNTSNPDEAAKAYAKAAAAQRALYNTGAAPAQIIGHNNIAELTFVWQPNSKRVHHTLHWLAKKSGKYDVDSVKEAYDTYWSRYDISLNLNDSDYPPIKAGLEV